jgi:hypothetical protein
MAARFIPIIIRVDGAKQGETEVKGFANAFDDLDTSAHRAGSHGMTSAFVAAELLTGALRQAFDLIKSGIIDTTLFAGRTEELTIALHQLAKVNGISNDEIDKQLKGLIDLNIAGQEARQILVQMIGANQNVAQATDLATVARNTAVISMKNTSEQLIGINNAILLGNTEAFRAVGIYISVEDALTKGAKAAKLDRDALTELQRHQILTNAVIEYGTRQTGLYEAAMGSATKQMRSLVRIHDDAKESVGGLFQGPFMLGVQVTTILLKLIAEYPAALLALTVGVLSLTAALVLMNTTALSSTVQTITSLIGSLRLLGQVVLGTASLIQGAAATTAVWTLGWGALIIAAGAAIYVISKASDVVIAADKVTQDQIVIQGKALDSAKEMVAAAREVASAQEGSAARHEKLNTILGRLDPVTRTYIESIKAEQDRVVALNATLDKTVDLRRASLEANAQVLAAAIAVQAEEVKVKEQNIAENKKLIDENQKLGSSFGLLISTGTVKLQESLDTLNKSLTENQAKVLDNAKVRGLSTEAFLAELRSSKLTGDQIQLLGNLYEKLTPKVNDTNSALNNQVKSLKDVKDQLEGLLKLGDLEIETKILDIVKNAKSAAEARRLAQDALRGETKTFTGRGGQYTYTDDSLGRLARQRQQNIEIEKAAREILEPSTKERRTPIERLEEEVKRAQFAVDALYASSGKAFDLKFKLEDLNRTKADLENILKLRHELGIPLDLPLPRGLEATQEVTRGLQRQLNTRQEITKLSESDLDNAEKIKVLDYQRQQAFLTLVGVDERHEKAMRTLIDLKALELDLSTQALDAAARTKAIEEWFAARRGAPTAGRRIISPALQRSIEEQAILFNEATGAAALTAARGTDFERERQKQLTAGAYEESNLRRRIVEEENLARFKSENDVDEEIRRISYRLTQNLISGEKLLELARSRAAEERRKQVQSSAIDVQLLVDQLGRLGKGDSQETAIAANNYLKTFYGTMVGVRQEIVAIRDLGGVNAIFNSAEFQKSLKEKFDLDQFHTIIDLGTQIAQSQYNIAHAAETSALRYQAAWQKAYEDVALASQRALEARAADDVKLAHQMDLDLNRIDDGVIHFLAEQKTLQQTFQDVRTNSVRSFFDGIDSAIDRMTKRLGIAGNVLGTFLKDLAHLAASALLQRLLGIGSGTGSIGFQPTSGGGGGGAGGGILNSFFNRVFGGGGAGQTQAVGAGGGITPPVSLTTQLGQQHELTHAIQLAGGGGASPVAPVSAVSSLVSSLPLLGAAYGAATWLGIFSGGVSNFQAATGGGILGFLINRNKNRRRDETTRNQAMLDSLGQLQQILTAVRSDRMDGGSAIAAAAEIRSQYINNMSALKDSKTRRIALADVSRLDAVIAQIRGEADQQLQRQAIDKKLVPEFASGGLVPYFGGLKTLIKVRPQERIDDVGLMRSFVVPGVDRGIDSVLVPTTPGSRVLTRSQQSRIPGFANGTPSALPRANSRDPITVEIYMDPVLTVDQGTAVGIIRKAARSSDGREVFLNVHTDARMRGKGK